MSFSICKMRMRRPDFACAKSGHGMHTFVFQMFKNLLLFAQTTHDLCQTAHVRKCRSTTPEYMLSQDAADILSNSFDNNL